MRISVAILGATGVVGQKLIALLQDDAHFEIVELVASDQRIGQAFSEACDWREPLMSMPASVAGMRLSGVQNLKAQFVASCLPAEVAERVEPMLTEQGKIVFSNASSFRMTDNVPLLVPEINASHLSLLAAQPTPGKLITNPNCSAVGITLGLAPLLSLGGGLKHASVVTMQSVSGAGYPGVPSLDILGNTIPHIGGEADKITEETKRILGSSANPASFAVTTHVHRVPVMFGHVATIHATFEGVVAPEQAVEQYLTWNERNPNLFILHDKPGRPQSTKDLRQDDMRIHIGHLRQGDQPNVLGFVVLSHNLVRGAAGAVLSNMDAYLKFQNGK